MGSVDTQILYSDFLVEWDYVFYSPAGQIYKLACLPGQGLNLRL